MQEGRPEGFSAQRVEEHCFEQAVTWLQMQRNTHVSLRTVCDEVNE